MRCLQCGKDVPLLKRLAGNEFCSDSHLREYQREYSQLALSRLQQSKPPEPEKKPTAGEGLAKVIPAAPSPPPKSEKPAFAVATRPAPIAKKPAPPARHETPRRTLPPVSQPAAPPTKTAPGDPGFAPPASIQKPVAASRSASAALEKTEGAFPALSPDRPTGHPTPSPAALPQATALRMDRRVHMMNAPVRPMEKSVGLRETPRAIPIFDLDLRIASSGSWRPRKESLPIPAMAGFPPEDAAPWTASHVEFTGASVALGGVANFQLSTTGFAEVSERSHPLPNLPLEPAMGQAPLAEVAKPQPQQAGHDFQTRKAETSFSGMQTATAACRALEAKVPSPMTTPLQRPVQVIPPATANPVQVFGRACFSPGTPLVPQPSSLPLRPLMVLRPKASAELDLGVPALHLPPPGRFGGSNAPKIMGAAAGVAAVALAIVLLAGDQSGVPSKPVMAASVASNRWIENFSTDAATQRKVSILQSSMSLPDYRLEFAGSIQGKALGWVYRAHDPKNYYVSTIETERRGPIPTFVIAHHAVINGMAQPRTETPLRVSVPLGTDYKIRFDAVGDRFITWVQGQKADEWTDARIKTGGAGMYKEGSQQFTLHGDFRVTALPPSGQEASNGAR